MPQPRVYRATLTVPPGVNRAYSVGQGRFYKNDTSNEWATGAHYALRAAGWKPLPKGDYRLEVECWLHARLSRDIDNILKSLLDAAAFALGTSDRYVFDLHVHKIVAKDKDAHLDVLVTVTPA